MLYEVGGHTKRSRMDSLIFFFHLKYHMIYAFVSICIVFVPVYQTHARRSENVLLSEAL